MSYQVLALKSRPKTFDEVVGQSTVTRTLKNTIATGRIGHAFLLSGARGVGKTSTARILAKALNCSAGENPTPDPCGECPSCREITAGRSLDVQEIDGATHNGVEQVRELRESARYNPARDRYKIWIIDEVHMLSTGAFNALLKTLEEPPPRVKFIFATTEYHKIPDTILSRCQQYDLRMIPAKDLLAHLRKVAAGENVRISDEALSHIVQAAEGSVRDALSLLDQVLSFSDGEVSDEDVSALLGLVDRELLYTASQGVLECDSRKLLDVVERLSDYGVDYRNFTRELLLHYRQILVLKVAAEGSPLLASIPAEEAERLRLQASAYSEEDLLRIFDVLTKTETDLRLAQDPRVTLEFTLLKLAQTRRLAPFTELVARVERLALDRAPFPAVTALPTASASVAPSATTVSAPQSVPQRIAIVEPPPAAAPPEPAVGPEPAQAGADGGLLAGMIAAAQGRPSLAQPLRSAQARVEGDTLVLEVVGDFAGFAAEHASEYQDLAAKAAGRKLKLRIGASVAMPVEQSPAEVKRARLMKEASREPAVQEVLDLFNGKVVDVREAKQ